MIPEDYRDLIDGKNFANIGTVNEKMQPHVTPVWIDHENYEKLVFNTAKGRVKHRNIVKNPQVSITIMDQENPYRYLMIQGKVTEITENGAREHIDKLAQKYMGKDKYPEYEGQVRIKVTVNPENISTMDG